MQRKQTALLYIIHAAAIIIIEQLCTVISANTLILKGALKAEVIR